MKHSVKITFLLIFTFLVAQLVGLNIVSQYVDVAESARTNTTVIRSDQYVVAPPEVENESTSWILIFVSILMGTVLILVMAKFGMMKLWKFWFSAAVFLALLVAFLPYMRKLFQYFGIPSYAIWASIVIVVILTYLKIWQKGVIAHNIAEIFIYGGIAALFVPIINIFSGIILLIGIAIYDAYAVWKSKHMITLAEFQKESAFAGINIPYTSKGVKIGETSAKKVKVSAAPHKNAERTSAILGGGDIAFPLLFAGAVLKSTGLYWTALVIVVAATFSLSLLLFLSKPGRYYPAMPFISGGCLLGYMVVLII